MTSAIKAWSVRMTARRPAPWRWRCSTAAGSARCAAPAFYKDGASAGDVEQGANGNCWMLAAVATVTNVPGLLERTCVARDEAVGVYGFVFQRDGEWGAVVVDDQLYISNLELHDSGQYLQQLFKDDEEDYKKHFFSSKALTFAKCADPNETWLPLLEKAYAKFHCDYSSLYGGFTGEGVEDLTGGVTSEIFTDDIMDSDLFWKDALLKVNKDFLFGASIYTNCNQSNNKRQGIVVGHVSLPLLFYNIRISANIDNPGLLCPPGERGQGRAFCSITKSMGQKGMEG